MTTISYGDTTALQDFLAEWANPQPTVSVHTSGSTGTPKDMSVSKRRMLASARMTCDFLHLTSADVALLCMPMQYIAGKMMVVRSMERGMTLVSVTPSAHPLSRESISDEAWEACRPTFAAFVPMQVMRSLEVAEERERLEQIRHVIIGGGAIDRQLEGQLRALGNAIWSTYGMTETLSHVALRRVSGSEGTLWYTPMDGISVSMSDRSTLTIDAPRLCDGTLHTNDIVEMNEKGEFRILGRTDNTINTGGVKVQIEEVERLLADRLPADMTSHYMVTSRPDSMYGEMVVMLVDGVGAEYDDWGTAIDALPRYWRPKQLMPVDVLPLTGNGKPDRAKAKAMAGAIATYVR